MRQRYNHSTSSQNMLSWKSWILISLCLIMIAIIVYTVINYNQLISSKTKSFSSSEARVLEETDIADINTIDIFNGDEAYHVIFGQRKDKTEEIAFVPLDKKKEIKTIKKSEIMADKEIKTKWRSNCTSCKWIKTTPAIIDEHLLWEMTYKDAKNRYVYDYRSIYDGELYEQFRITSIYK